MEQESKSYYQKLKEIYGFLEMPTGSEKSGFDYIMLTAITKIESMGYQFKQCRRRVQIYKDLPVHVKQDPLVIAKSNKTDLVEAKKDAAFQAVYQFIEWHKAANNKLPSVSTWRLGVDYLKWQYLDMSGKEVVVSTEELYRIIDFIISSKLEGQLYNYIKSVDKTNKELDLMMGTGQKALKQHTKMVVDGAVDEFFKILVPNTGETPAEAVERLKGESVTLVTAMSSNVHDFTETIKQYLTAKVKAMLENSGPMINTLNSQPLHACFCGAVVTKSILDAENLDDQSPSLEDMVKFAGCINRAMENGWLGEVPFCRQFAWMEIYNKPERTFMMMFYPTSTLTLKELKWKSNLFHAEGQMPAKLDEIVIADKYDLMDLQKLTDELYNANIGYTMADSPDVMRDKLRGVYNRNPQ